MLTYCLVNVDTNEEIIKQESDLPIHIWEGRVCRKLLRLKRTPERSKQAIREGNVLPCLDSQEVYRMRQKLSRMEYAKQIHFIFKDEPLNPKE